MEDLKIFIEAKTLETLEKRGFKLEEAKQAVRNHYEEYGALDDVATLQNENYGLTLEIVFYFSEAQDQLMCFVE